MLYNTGARVSEIANLQVADVVVESSPSVHIRGKGRKHVPYRCGGQPQILSDHRDVALPRSHTMAICSRTVAEQP